MSDAPFEQFKGRGLIPGRLPSADPLRDPAGYLASSALANAVNVALALGMPLLVTGEPGTGKTQLAYRMAAELGFDEVLRFDTKSSSQAQELFYQFDSIRQFAQSQLNAAAREPLPQAREFLRLNALGAAIVRSLPADDVARRLGTQHARNPCQSLVLIDEIDKAPRDFPNDLLNQIEDKAFLVSELGERFQAEGKLGPVVVITSNSEKQLPEPFLRRCVYHHIEFPKDEAELQAILGARLSRLKLQGRAFDEALAFFFNVRKDARITKKPSTSELLDWLRALHAAKAKPDVPLAQQPELAQAALGSLLKTREDQEHGARLLLG
jgi:MoxR-like ATPase